MIKKLFFINNVDWGFTEFRLPIAQRAIAEGVEVHLITELTGKYKREELLKDSGIIVHDVNFKRGSSNPLHLLTLFFKVFFILKKHTPEIVHLITIKSVLIGGLAARLAKINALVFAISGLGYAYIEQGIPAKIRKALISFLYKIVFNSQNILVIFQNKDDKEEIISKNKNLPHLIIPGSGVDLLKFKFVDEVVTQIPRITMISRLLVHKGVLEFVEAARLIKEQNIKAQFELIGDLDSDNPASLTLDQCKEIEESGNVVLKGYIKDVALELENTNLVVLPSYREGFPKALIEASACGRAIVTTDVPGCREAVEHKKNGLLVPKENPYELAKAVRYLIENKNERREMGLKSRKIAEDKYSINQVVDTHMKIYEEINRK